MEYNALYWWKQKILRLKELVLKINKIFIYDIKMLLSAECKIGFTKTDIYQHLKYKWDGSYFISY